MNKEIIAKQKKLLGLIFGMWALVIVNSFLYGFLNRFDLGYANLGHVDNEFVTIVVYAFSIFQMWAIYKYILKK